MGKIWGLLLCTGFLVFSSNASAVLKCGTAGIKIDVKNLPYSTLDSVTKQDVGISDEWVLRAEVMTSVAGGLQGPSARQSSRRLYVQDHLQGWNTGMRGSEFDDGNSRRSAGARHGFQWTQRGDGSGEHEPVHPAVSAATR